MAWSSLTTASRHLVLALRTKTPRNVAYLHQSQKVMVQIPGGKGPFGEMLRNFASPGSSGVIKQKLKSVANPVSDRKEIPLIMISAAVLGYYAWSLTKKKDKKMVDDVTVPMIQNTPFFTPSLVYNETISLGSKLPPLADNGPCEPCGDTDKSASEHIVNQVPGTDADGLDSSGVTDTSAIPSETESSEMSEPRKNHSSKKRRRKSKAAVEEDDD